MQRVWNVVSVSLVVLIALLFCFGTVSADKNRPDYPDKDQVFILEQEITDLTISVSTETTGAMLKLLERMPMWAHMDIVLTTFEGETLVLHLSDTTLACYRQQFIDSETVFEFTEDWHDCDHWWGDPIVIEQ